MTEVHDLGGYQERAQKRDTCMLRGQEVRTFFDGCLLAIAGAEGEIEAIEKKIKDDLLAAAS